MGIDVELVTERGERIEGVTDVHDFVDAAIAAVREGSRILRYVDPYGDLTLNRPQMADFREDWNRAKPLANSDHEKRTWAQIDGLATRCETEPHVYLRFVGD